jgi:phospholipid/cholesterol/gamma-HCH transport system substrate-binding protein
MTPNRERVWVGLFVIIAGVVFSVTAVAVWGSMGRSGIAHRAYFKFGGGVQPGTAVRYVGLRVGTVQKVQIDSGDPSRVRVDLVVEPGTPLKTDSVARLATLGPLSDNYIEISAGSASAALLPPDAVLTSAESLGFAQLGDTIQTMVPQIHEALDKLTQNLDGLQTTVTRVNDLLNDNNRSNIGQTIARANDLLSDRNRANVAGSLNNLNQLLTDTRPKVNSALSNVNDATERLVPLLDEVKKTSVRADQVLANLDSALTENRPDLRVSVSELREVLASSTTAVDQLQSIMSQNTVTIYEILENIRLASSNIRALTETVKRSPSSLIRGVKTQDRRPGGSQQ